MAPKWRDDINLKFIKLYKERPCLWNHHDELYKDKNARKAALTEIVENMNIKGFGIAEVKHKIKAFRGTFNIELTKLERSMKSGSEDVYVPTLRWFNAMKEVMLPEAATMNKKSTLDGVSDLCEVSGLCETSNSATRNDIMIIDGNFYDGDLSYEEEVEVDPLGTSSMFASDLSEQAEIPSNSCHRKRKRLEARSPSPSVERNNKESDTETFLKVKRVHQLIENEAELHRYSVEKAKLALKEQELKVKILEVQLQKELNNK